MGAQRFTAVAVVLVVAAAVAGCLASTDFDEPITMRVVLADDWAGAPAVREVIDEFERDAEGRILVELEGVPFSQIADRVAADRDLGRPYDLAHWHAFAAAASGLAEPVDDLWEAAGLDPDAYLPGALDGVTWDGQRYGVPLDTNALVLLVNLEVLRAAGFDLDDLATPEGFREVAGGVVAAGVVDHALTVSTSTWAAYGWIQAHGGDLLAAGSHPPTFTFEDPGVVAALELLGELVDEELAPRPRAMALAPDAIGAFAQGEVAMHATGSWDLTFRDRAASVAVEQLAVVRLPQADPARPRTVLGGSSLFVPVDTPHRQLAFDLAMRLTDDEVALRLASEEGRLPARRELLSDARFVQDPLLAAVVAELDHARLMPLIAYPDAQAAFAEGVEDVVTGRSPAAEVLATVQRTATAGVRPDAGPDG